MAKGGPAAPRIMGPLFGLVIIGVLGLIVLGVMKIAPAVKHDWKMIGDMRAKDAATVEAEREAGKTYIDKLQLTLAASTLSKSDGKVNALLTGKITDTGNKDVIKAVAKVKFLPAQGDTPVETRDVVLFNASDLSVTTDRPLVGGETRDISIAVNGVSPDWGGGIAYEITEVRVSVGKE